ncbi:hypothetical protein FSP39_008204 [Pinctada imbricata]|uniref:C2H2-type domain-containing protein n=1 Tax=Pinctada imbricata TaxID=66713 RepID=A0AA89BX16_PINIB|nr:hypothetical protein FSP39_008204 [Pinctada imbricata]
MDENLSLSCPENGCICTFDSYVQMQNHCLIANHEFSSSSSTFDRIKLRWKDTCFDMSTGVHRVKFESRMKSGSSMSEMVLALKKDKKNARFSEKVKGYLLGIFEAGDVSGRKANPSTVVQNMRVARNDDGSNMFKPLEYLELSQNCSYFSRLACLKRSGKLQGVVEDHDLEAIIHAINTEEAKAQLV